MEVALGGVVASGPMSYSVNGRQNVAVSLATLCSRSHCASESGQIPAACCYNSQLLQDSSFGTGIRESVWIFPIIETVHLLALAFSVGIIGFVDLRLVRAGMRDYPVSEVFARLQPIAVEDLAIDFAGSYCLENTKPEPCTILSPVLPLVVMMKNLILLFSLTMFLSVVGGARGRDCHR